MAVKDSGKGRLIAVDGSRGRDTIRAARAIAKALKHQGLECAVSQWDASGLFADLAIDASNRAVSARTLALLYAADLAFRLRWEIQPILDSGGIVIAAPYVETASAFGIVSGVGEAWVRELLRFAPAAQTSGRAVERKPGKRWKRRRDHGYVEYCAALLETSQPKAASTSARRKMIATLTERGGKRTISLTPKGINAIVRAITGSRRAAPSS